MPTPFDFRGVIFDVDDTLLDNLTQVPENGLHERSRLAAIHEVGRRYGAERLINVSPEENLTALLTSQAHTLESCVWNLLYTTGIVASEDIDPSNVFLQEIVTLKHELYETILRAHGREIAGASDFICLLAQSGLRNHMAIASSSIRRDIDIFFDLAGLSEYFPDNRIVSREDVKIPKPHPEAFNLAFATLGLPESSRNQTLAFEDDIRGVAAAKAAGLHTCAITTRFTRDTFAVMDTPPDLIAGSFAEFTELLGLSASSVVSTVDI